MKPLTEESEGAALRRTEEEQRRLELYRAQREADLHAVMSTPRGRRVVWQLLDGKCHLFAASFTGDALTSAFNEGRRIVGLELMVELQRVVPRFYTQMLTEALEEQERAAVEGPKPAP